MNVLINGARAETETCITIQKDDIKLHVQNETHKREDTARSGLKGKKPD